MTVFFKHNTQVILINDYVQFSFTPTSMRAWITPPETASIGLLEFRVSADYTCQL